MFEYIISANENLNSVLTTNIKNDSDYIILAGPANVFFNSSFVGTRKIEICCKNERFKCLIGIDPSINVNYNPVEKTEIKKGFFKKTKLMKFVQNIEIQSTNSYDLKNISFTHQIFDNQNLKIKNLSCYNMQIISNIKHREKIKFMLHESNKFECNLSIRNNSCLNLIIKYYLKIKKQ